MEISKSEKDGLKFGSLSISGKAVFGRLRVENGVHRVQVTPLETEMSLLDSTLRGSLRQRRLVDSKLVQPLSSSCFNLMRYCRDWLGHLRGSFDCSMRWMWCWHQQICVSTSIGQEEQADSTSTRLRVPSASRTSLHKFQSPFRQLLAVLRSPSR